MKFIALTAIVDDKLEEKAIDVAKKAGAGSVTIVKGNNIPLVEKKVFGKLTFEESVSLLLFILPKRLSVKVMKALKSELELDKDENGVVFTIPLSHVAGLNLEEINDFEEKIVDTL